MASQVALAAAVTKLGRVGVEEMFFPFHRSINGTHMLILIIDVTVSQHVASGGKCVIVAGDQPCLLAVSATGVIRPLRSRRIQAT
jgi:hypothetical protein